jgi:hypothetical protein
MNARFRYCVLFVSLLAAQLAHAAFVVDLLPNQPVAGENVFVHVVSTTGLQCFPPFADVSQNGQAIDMKLFSTDACAGEDYVSERTYPVGAFPAGAYALDIEHCVLNPPPIPSGCTLLASFSFTVSGAGGANAAHVPADAHWAIGMLVLLLVIAASAAIGRSPNGSTRSG